MLGAYSHGGGYPESSRSQTPFKVRILLPQKLPAMSILTVTSFSSKPNEHSNCFNYESNLLAQVISNIYVLPNSQFQL